MMKPHPRIRKSIKWGSAAVTVLLVVVWIGSCWAHVLAFDGAGRGWSLASGRLTYLRSKGQMVVVAMLDAYWASRPQLLWAPGWKQDWMQNWAYPMPLWIPSALALVLTAGVWRFDALARRRVRLNLCPKCRYERAGLAAGAKCPECGAAES